MSEEHVKIECVCIDPLMLYNRLGVWSDALKEKWAVKHLRKFSIQDASEIFSRLKSLEDDFSWLINDVEWQDRASR